MTVARRPLRRWLASTSNRTFIVYPALVVAAEWLVHGDALRVSGWAAPLLAWGYLQYRLAGNYRLKHGRGGPGMSVPPERLVTAGPYRWTRNPMYLGHLIFMAGLALTFHSWLAALLLAYHLHWFNERAKQDEAQLANLFGAEYALYRGRVKRWIPGVL